MVLQQHMLVQQCGAVALARGGGAGSAVDESAGARAAVARGAVPLVLEPVGEVLLHPGAGGKGGILSRSPPAY